eukprot:COSAG02_NODE_63163_length_264_cov_0.575758_1_plen_42_part_10
MSKQYAHCLINESLAKRDVISRAHVIDPGAYNAVRCTPEGAF